MLGKSRFGKDQEALEVASMTEIARASSGEYRRARQS
jgi:hypothetical protein